MRCPVLWWLNSHQGGAPAVNRCRRPPEPKWTTSRLVKIAQIAEAFVLQASQLRVPHTALDIPRAAFS